MLFCWKGQNRDESSKTQTASAAPAYCLPPAFIFNLPSLQHQSQSFNCFGCFTVSPTLSQSRQDNGSVLYAHSPILVTVAWIQHVKNHINISPEEGISASNGIGLQGKRIQSGEGREDGAGQRWCIIEVEALGFWNHPATEELLKQQNNRWDYLPVHWFKVLNVKSIFQYYVVLKLIGWYNEGGEFHYSAIITKKQSAESKECSRSAWGTEIKSAQTHRNSHIIIEAPGQRPPHGPTLAELCVCHFRHLRKKNTMTQSH